MTTMEKQEEALQLENGDVGTPEIGTPESKRSSLESVRREAVGGQSIADLPARYYRSPQYIASFIVSFHSPLFYILFADPGSKSFALSYQSSFLGYVMPANALTIINADIGKFYFWVTVFEGPSNKSQVQVLMRFGFCWYLCSARQSHSSSSAGCQIFLVEDGTSSGAIHWLWSVGSFAVVLRASTCS
jgi:hypothetical protein